MEISGGYLGKLTVDGTVVRCDSFSVNLTQTPLFYEHTIGLRDNIPTTPAGAKGDTAFNNNPQNSIYRPSVKSITGSFSFPLSSNNAKVGFDRAKDGNPFTITYGYGCDLLRTLTGCRVKGYTIKVSATEVAKASVEVMCTGITEGSYSPDGTGGQEKLITWDAVSITGIGDPNYVQDFSMTITNDCKYVYTAGVNNEYNLAPATIRIGMQSVKGSIVYYNGGTVVPLVADLSVNKDLIANFAGLLSFNLNCVFSPIERAGSISPYLSTYTFNGVGSYWS